MCEKGGLAKCKIDWDQIKALLLATGRVFTLALAVRDREFLGVFVDLDPGCVGEDLLTSTSGVSICGITGVLSHKHKRPRSRSSNVLPLI
jgi:hypothetical protein